MTQRLSWTTFYASIGAAWCGLLVLSNSHPSTPWLGALDSAFSYELLQSLCTVRPTMENFVSVFTMWSIMVVAMMLPSAIPFLRVYGEVASAKPERAQASFLFVVLGYLLVWLVYCLSVSAAQVALAQYGHVSMHGIIVAPVACAGVLMLAGLYQFSGAKTATLAECQHPMLFLFSHWRDGRAGAVRLGALHGVRCASCCWALMLLALVAGTMNLLFMGLATALMAAEKLAWLGSRLRIFTGVALVMAAGIVLGRWW
ncbi:MAG: DUF2182 domain-containing protein [Gammaproteobacteria bacterium]|nr:DUF2182 domain-containing protein [Gammaproteobacteria bacterium]